MWKSSMSQVRFYWILLECFYLFLQIKLEKCAGCKQPIKNKYIKALGKKWHLDHFKCSRCSKIISTQTYLQKNGLPYCKNDFLELFCHRCGKCDEYILTVRSVLVFWNFYSTNIFKEAVEALDQFWHVGCFTCTTCNQPIKPPDYFAKEGKPYCIEDYEKNFAPRCKGCGNYIFENYLRVLGGMWHSRCFLCKVKIVSIL